MADFLANNQMYIVLFIVLLVWSGIIVYLFRLDKKLKNLEERIMKD